MESQYASSEFLQKQDMIPHLSPYVYPIPDKSQVSHALRALREIAAVNHLGLVPVGGLATCF